MSEELKLSLEKEATGLYLSGHPMDKYASFLKNAKMDKIVDIIGGKHRDGKRITIAGIIENLKVRQLKNGNLLASFQIEDITASISVTMFNKTYAENKHLLDGQRPVILSGRISEREDRETEIIAEKIDILNEAEAKPKEKKFEKGLYLKIESLQDIKFSKVKDILKEYRGDIPVFIYCLDTKRKLEASNELKIRENDDLFNKLSEVLGSNNVKFIK